jgi:hypothetical protein
MVLPTEEFLERKRGLFTSEEGGFYATNDQDIPSGNIIYYFGVIDILTTVSLQSRINLILVRIKEASGDVFQIVFESA